MKLGFNLDFESLNNIEGLTLLDSIFLNFIKNHDITIYNFLLEYRTSPNKFVGKEYSSLIITLSPLLNDFISELFGINESVDEFKTYASEFDIIAECRRKFVQRFAVKKYPKDKLSEINFDEISKSLALLFKANITQRVFATVTLEWLKRPDDYSEELDIAAKYASFMVYNNSNSELFNLPQIIDKGNLLAADKIEKHKSHVRFGFDYFAPELTNENALGHAHYCIYCHNQQKDSCSKGLKASPQAINIDNKNGCPLRQKISEMNYVKARGFDLAALAITTIDNPMAAITGHRICNDCMNSCIFQKQEPVNIPLIESNILANVLSLPYGFEIYALLTRWNPLNIHTPLPKISSNYNVLVVGLGPAGISLAHYLTNEGHNVVAVDGLKISPLSLDPNQPIKDWNSHTERLSIKAPQGFGGVAEYGITARWDKNNLTILRIILERRANFKLYSGIRFESNITESQAFELGFDHIALCTGAAQPKLPKLSNTIAKGVRTASDFLMTLQNGGSYLKDSLTNLTLRLPVAIIGCGLTAVDCAVEALNYYPVQVEKFSAQYENIAGKFGSNFVRKNWNQEEQMIANEFLEHAKLFKAQSPEKIREIIINELGGVTIYYRGDLKDSPGYKLNHEEILHAIAAGIKFIDHMTLDQINIDDSGHVESLNFASKNIIAKTVLMAIGTEQSQMEIASNRSYFGDCNPNYAGSVVKALASSKDGYENITQHLMARKPNYSGNWQNFIANLDNLLVSKIHKVNILSNNIIELIVHSPQAVKNFRPGQFFKLQNYSSTSAELMEPIALTGAYIDYEQQLISLIVLEVGKSSSLCRKLTVGEEIVLMGPTGQPTEILTNANVVLIGGGLGNAVLFSIGKALKDNGCKVTYIAGYRHLRDRFYSSKIEEAADIVIWCCEEGMMLKNRVNDISLKGNVIDGMKNYLMQINEKPERIICIGSDSMMSAVNSVKKELFPTAKLICSINSPMQCMMKGICGQCVQQVADTRGYIFTCACQDTNADFVDFDNLKSRLTQNSLQEKLTALS